MVNEKIRLESGESFGMDLCFHLLQHICGAA